MTFPLRELHYRVMGWLMWLLPVMLLAGLAGYDFRVYTEIPDPQWAATPSSAELEHSVETGGEDATERGVPMRVEVYKAQTDGAGNPRRWVRIEPRSPLRQPDLLVYWSSRQSTFEEPPAGAFLLGVFDPRLAQTFKLPPQADYVKGYLLVYSLGQRVLISQALLPSPM